MGTILERLQKTGVAMEDNAIRDVLGDELQQLAIKAMMNGIHSKEWKSYMSLFADNVEQLTRLTVPQPGEDSWLTESRAYIVANAICGADSTTQTSLRVDEDIDSDVSNEVNGSVVDPGGNAPNGAIVRPITIP